MIFNPVIFGAGGSSDILYIYVAQLPDKRDYYTGENFDPTGMIVKGVKQDLTEVVIPNDQLSYLPPMPLTLESELLRLLYTDQGQTYGTTLALNILIGIWLSETISAYPLYDVLLPIDMNDDGLVALTDVIRISLSEQMDEISTNDVLPIETFTESLSPKAPIVRAIFEFDTSVQYVTRDASNRVILQTNYSYAGQIESIDSGNLVSVVVRNDDKVSVESVVINVNAV